MTKLAHVPAARRALFARRQLSFARQLHARIGTVETLANLHYWRAQVWFRAMSGLRVHVEDDLLRVAMTKARAEFGA